jgi:hypothetical protein
MESLALDLNCMTAMRGDAILLSILLFFDHLLPREPEAMPHSRVDAVIEYVDVVATQIMLGS